MSKTKVIDLPLICIGQDLSVPLENLTNNSDYTATDVIVSVSVPAGVTFKQANIPRGSYDSVSNIWTIGTMAAKETLFGELIFTVTDDCLAPFKFNYTIGTTNNCDDPDTSNNAACVLIQGLSCCAITEKCEDNLALDDAYVVPQDTPYTFDASLNDLVCPASTTRTFAWIENPSNGSLSGNPESTTYTPNTGFCGVDKAVYGLYCNGNLIDKAEVFFNVSCGLPVSDGFVTPVDTNLNEDVSVNDLPCINGGTTVYELVTCPSCSGGGLSEATDIGDVTVTSWNRLTGEFTLTPTNGFVGTATFYYTIGCVDPVTGLQWNSNPVAVRVGIPTANPSPDPDSCCSGNVLDNDTTCSSGVTTVVLDSGSEYNCTVNLNPNGAYSVAITDLTDVWSFKYDILCDGIFTASNTITGGAVNAVAADDDQGTTGPGQQTVNLSANDAFCSQGGTSFQIVGGTEVNVIIDDFDSLTSIVKFTPLAVGAWSFDYQIVCTVCGISQALGTGTAFGTVAASSSLTASSSNVVDSSSIAAPSSSRAASSSNIAASSSGAPSSSNVVSSSNAPAASSSAAPASSKTADSSNLPSSSNVPADSSSAGASSSNEAASSSAVGSSSNAPDSSSVPVPSSSLNASSSAVVSSSNVMSSSLPASSSRAPESSRAASSSPGEIIQPSSSVPREASSSGPGESPSSSPVPPSSSGKPASSSVSEGGV